MENLDRTIIDTRPAEEYKKGSMDAALNIPEDKLVEYLENPEEADLNPAPSAMEKPGKRA